MDTLPPAGTGADKARLAYVLPNFQNPTGRTMTEARRAALVAKAAELNIPLIEDNPMATCGLARPRLRP